VAAPFDGIALDDIIPDQERMRMKLSKFVAPYQVEKGKQFRLKDFDPADTAGLNDEFKPKSQELLQHGIQRLAELQEVLYAQDRWSLLLIFQAMDAAGKDGTIKHVMSGVNPQGVQVYSFKVPSEEELNHDFLWRTNCRLPERGHIGIFNRSYYEETLVVRVHPEFLAKEKMPNQCVTKEIWRERFDDICNYESYLHRNGVIIRKFFLHVSKHEQKKRFLERLDHPAKNWKFSTADLKERALWSDYQDAYEDMIQHTATEHAPWFVIPADNKWFARLVVAGAIVETLEKLNLSFPKVTTEKAAELKQARVELEKGEKTKTKSPR
jgi:PPK2 family polyphosphate:nucleotide phosphotransferase